MASSEMATKRETETESKSRRVIMRGWERLPSDIDMEILSRLPVKTLCKFRCVSKSWSALIADPIFVQSHRNRSSRQDPRLLLTREDRCYTYYKDGRTRISEFEIEMKDMRPVNTCMELVCMYNSSDVSICNPATREAIALPPSPLLPREATLARHTAVGFGYAPSTKEFKVVRVFRRTSSPGLGTEVFTVGRDTRWREAGDPGSLHRDTYRMDLDAASAHGAIHFLAKRMVDVAGGDHACIARFDLDQEGWSVLPVPPGLIHEPIRQCSLHGLDGDQLCLVSSCCPLFPRGGGGLAVEMWLLKDYGRGEWVREFTLNAAVLFRYDVPSIRPLAIGVDGRILVHEGLRSVLQYFDSQGRRRKRIEVGTLLYFDSEGRRLEPNGVGKEILDKCVICLNRLQFDNCCLYVESLLPLH